MNLDRLLESVKKHEGYRNKVYLDTLGKRTVGVGHLCVEDFWEDDKEYEEELQSIFDKDLKFAIDNAEALISENDVGELPETVKHVLTEMCFQLGKSGVAKFKNMWKCLQEGNFIGASYEMLDSKWNKQTPNRCKKLSDLMKSCG